MRILEDWENEEFTVIVPLNHGRIALIDINDAPEVLKYKWHGWKSKKGKSYYVCRGKKVNKKQTIILLHRFLLNAKKEELVDHKDRNGLNCRRKNIRIATRQQNNINSVQYNPLGFRGITENKNKFLAGISYDNKSIHLGTFNDAKSAARAYDKKAKELHGEFAILNFIM